MNKNKNVVFQVDFKKLDRYAWSGFIPAVLAYDKYVFSLSTWQELLKIFYYLAYKEPNGSEFFSLLTNNEIAVIGNKLVAKPATFVGKLLRGKNVFTDNSALEGIRFYKNNYVSYFRTFYFKNNGETINNLTLESSVIDNLEIMGYIINSLGLKNIQVYLACSENRQEQVESEKTIIIKELTSKVNGKRKVKNTKYFLAHINGEILSPEEKFYKRIEQEFDKKVLLGDIYISPEEEAYLKKFMAMKLRTLDNSGKLSNFHPKVFAFGLVRYAMKHYSQKTFWPYFIEEYGIDVKVQNQGTIHDEFCDIMCANGKIYDKDCAMKIDNISMHSFVTDCCANKFFDYLFDYWRIDLRRNVDNIYGDAGKKYFKFLLEEIESNNDSSINGVMKHTSMALKHHKKSCVLRIRRILQLMDECSFDRTKIIPQTGNRINALLQKWMEIKNGKFQKEFKFGGKKAGIRGESLLSHPLLRANFYQNDFDIKLPQEILRHCENSEHPYWVISAIGLPSLTIEPVLYEGSIGLYTEECEIALPREYLFKKITMTLVSEKRQYAKFNFGEADVRFFNDKGLYFDGSKGYMPAGMFIAYSKAIELPQILYGDRIVPMEVGGIYVGQYQLKYGDIVVYPDNHAIPVGEKIAEGLIGEKLKQVVAKVEDSEIAVYRTLPKILFKTKREYLAGSMLQLYDSKGNEKYFRISEHNYCEFKLDDTLEDTYAYLIDLKDYINTDGSYIVNINLPGSKSRYCYEFAYLSKLSFSFEDAPYIFKDNGTIIFSGNSQIETDADWDISSNQKVLRFNFDKDDRECSNEVVGMDLMLYYRLSDSKLPLLFRIPALFWKFNKGDEWSHKRPADLSIKSMPTHLYVCGPFDFRNKNTKLNIDDKTFSSFDETDIYAERVKDENYFSFYLTNLKSWLDYTYSERTVFLTLEGQKYQLNNIICRSSVKMANLSGDYENNTIHGYFEIIGDSEYTVKVERDGIILGQDIALVNGEFELETDTLGGTYAVTVYEIIEDESGFEFDSIKLVKCFLNIVNLASLQNNIIYIKEFAYSSKKYKPLELGQKYIIRDLAYLGRYKDVSELVDGGLINGLWKFDIYDANQMRNCIFYIGKLGWYCESDGFCKEFEVLVIFYDQYDVNKIIVLRECDGEYVELLYDRKTHQLLSDEKKLNLKQWQIKERILTLEDDLYDCIAEIKT